MTTSQVTSTLSSPHEEERVPVGTFGYFRARNRHRLHSLVLREFVKSGITQATLARRMGKNPDVVCRWLGAPGNWTLDTVSDLLFAISGGELQSTVHHPLDDAALNDVQPDWLQAQRGVGAQTIVGTVVVDVNGLPSAKTQIGSGSNVRPVALVAN